MRRVNTLLLGLVFACSNLAASSQEPLVQPGAVLAGPETRFPKLANPPALLSHTESSSLSFLLGTWVYNDESESIEETWLKSSLDEWTCVRIKRIITSTITPTIYSTIPTLRDPSLPKIETVQASSSPVKSLIQEKEIYTVRDAGRGAAVSSVRLDSSGAAVSERWVGSLDQDGPDRVSLKLLNVAVDGNREMTLSYEKGGTDRVNCLVFDGKIKRVLQLVRLKG